FFFCLCSPPRSTLFPYTTLFRSNAIEEEGYLELGRQLGLEYKAYSVDRPYVLNGFEDMELSTQLLIFDALQLGIGLEIIDRADQDRKSTRLNSSHVSISYAVFCL